MAAGMKSTELCCPILPSNCMKTQIFQLSFLIAGQTGLFPPAKIVDQNVTAFSIVNIQECMLVVSA